jgi:TusA-related sulfurtransferase
VSLPDITEHQSLNLCGLRCPHLLIRVIQAIESIESGTVLQIRATDLNAPSSITAWARQSGNQLIDMYQEGECFVFLLKRIPQEVAQQATVRQKEESRKLTADR